MLSRLHASQEQFQAPGAFEGLREHAREIVLVGGLLGAATFALLPFVPSLSNSISSMRGEISILVGVAAAVIATGWLSLRSRRKARATSSGDDARNVAAKRQVASPSDRHLMSDLSGRETVARQPKPESELSYGALADVSFARSVGDTVQNVMSPAAPSFTDIDALTARIKARRPSGGGQRTIITGEADNAAQYSVALELVKSLSDGGAQTILVDWSPSAEGIARAAGLDPMRGFNDLVGGKARFDDIIQHLPGTRAHAIASGEPMSGSGQKLDPDFLNLALDALDEVYDFIIVTGRRDEARVLFECIEGRFDAGVLVVSSNDASAPVEPAGTFLGFEVADIDILHYRRRDATVSPIAGRIALATRSPETIAQRA